MVTLAQRIEALRTEKGLSRPALAAALGLPRNSIEKFETGRQTPSSDQQTKIAAFFAVSINYLRGEVDDPTRMETWLSGNITEPAPVSKPAVKAAVREVLQSSGEAPSDGPVFQALLKSPSFRAMVKDTVAEYLRSTEGQVLMSQAVKRELGRRA